ncbi:hypothetical protein [Nostoc flagelliforme]|uniref:hypothetical protein n=1 Tax=Nostoc flagelliforme TaxID=1306274 RepID=UPI0026D516E6
MQHILNSPYPNLQPRTQKPRIPGIYAYQASHFGVGCSEEYCITSSPTPLSYFEGGTVRGMTTRQARIALDPRFGSRTKVPQTVLTIILSSR